GRLGGRARSKIRRALGLVDQFAGAGHGWRRLARTLLGVARLAGLALRNAGWAAFDRNRILRRSVGAIRHVGHRVVAERRSAPVVPRITAWIVVQVAAIARVPAVVRPVIVVLTLVKEPMVELRALLQVVVAVGMAGRHLEVFRRGNGRGSRATV